MLVFFAAIGCLLAPSALPYGIYYAAHNAKGQFVSTWRLWLERLWLAQQHHLQFRRKGGLNMQHSEEHIELAIPIYSHWAGHPGKKKTVFLSSATIMVEVGTPLLSVSSSAYTLALAYSKFSLRRDGEMCSPQGRSDSPPRPQRVPICEDFGSTNC